ncbi:MAG: dihydrolipoamide acetyltransferase family protein [Chloroflexota bacterium]|nr:dihydrolipoamide acetyltransferase family protein [Chloroflexota bacterium]MDE2921043.1 dihydrolipoamide acetyltransferase family protein [Chloroflexota bacterium]
MATELRLPDLGEGIADADVLSVLVSAGQAVAKDEPIIEIESDKATLEVPAELAGTVTQVLVSAGDTLQVGQTILELEESDSAADVKPQAPPPATAPAGPSAVTETPAATPASTPALSRTQPSPTPSTQNLPPPPPASGDFPVFASPSTRGFAREIGLDIREVPGSGPAGRISIDDVKAHARARPSTQPAASVGLTSAPLPDFSKFGAIRRERMNRVRRATATNIAQSWSTIPHVTLFNDADITSVETMRQREKDRVRSAGGSLTITPILMKVVAAALKAHPKMNASADFTANEMVLKDYCHLGVAADTDRGLLVPVIRDVDEKSITELAIEVTEVAAQVREGQLPPERLEGASFTISNLGGLGTGHFTPIINPPEVGILGIGRAVERPVYIEGLLRPRLMLPLALSFDHRAVDGADGARFLTWIVEALAQPLMLAMGD